MANAQALDLQLRGKVTLHLVAPLTFLVFLNSLDRVNVSFAALKMNADLELDPKSYGFGVGVFFFAYLLFQFPHTFVLRKIGARRWIFGAVLFWGVVATTMAAIQNATEGDSRSTSSASAAPKKSATEKYAPVRAVPRWRSATTNSTRLMP